MNWPLLALHALTLAALVVVAVELARMSRELQRGRPR